MQVATPGLVTAVEGVIHDLENGEGRGHFNPYPTNRRPPAPGRT